jgi:2-C-methyl-D-erythritol 4-phosphate cytidylyltransferase
VAAVTLKESIRRVIGAETVALNRNEFRLIQTPQTFEVRLLKKAYNTNFHVDFTDDASVVEKSGIQISLFKGRYDNLKITTPEDLIIAETLLLQRNAKKN